MVFNTVSIDRSDLETTCMKSVSPETINLFLRMVSWRGFTVHVPRGEVKRNVISSQKDDRSVNIRPWKPAMIDIKRWHSKQVKANTPQLFIAFALSVCALSKNISWFMYWCKHVMTQGKILPRIGQVNEWRKRVRGEGKT